MRLTCYSYTTQGLIVLLFASKGKHYVRARIAGHWHHVGTYKTLNAAQAAVDRASAIGIKKQCNIGHL